MAMTRDYSDIIVAYLLLVHELHRAISHTRFGLHRGTEVLP